MARVSVSNLRCESMWNPLGIDVQHPRLSWMLTSKERGVEQAAFQVIVARDKTDIENGRRTYYDSGRVQSGECQCLMGRPASESRQRFHWAVRIWDSEGNATPWSDPASFEMGLLNPADWSAKWIEPYQRPVMLDSPEISNASLQDSSNAAASFANQSQLWMEANQREIDPSKMNPCPMLRKEFVLKGKVGSARVYATAHGTYRIEINATRVGDLEFAPEATAYDKYLQYQTYDVADLLKTGTNALGVTLADGWWAGRIGMWGSSAQYGDKLALLLQLEVEYEDGTREVIVSDRSFKSLEGPLRYADLYIGEMYDARLEKTGWSEAGYNFAGWQPVAEVDYGTSVLVGQNAEPIRIAKKVTATRVYTSPRGETIIDFGQVMSGNARIVLKGQPGQKVSFLYTEETDKDGNYWLGIVGPNKNHRDIYILKGEKEEVYEPRFTYRGFRYIKVEGYEGKLEPRDAEARLICSSMDIVGSFECSDKRVSRLQENILWTTLGNMISIPTDNPDRERAGWTGDAQIFAPTACCNLGMQAFWTRWLRQMALEQKNDGQVPMVIPYWKGYAGYAKLLGDSTPGWSDACVIIPWVVYNQYGDRRILEENYPMMVRWIDYFRRNAEKNPPNIGEVSPERKEWLKYICNTGFSFGDWLTPSANMEGGVFNYVARPLDWFVPTFFYATTTHLMSKVAGALGKAEDSVYYAELTEKISEAAIKEFYDTGKIMGSDKQAALVLALQVGFVPKEKKKEVFQRLRDLIAKNNGIMDTGFTSTQAILDVFVKNGAVKEAYDLLFQDKFPSWLWEVDHGATAIWESWMAIMPDGTRQPVSFIQYANGVVGDWMFRTIGGINAAAPGYKRIRIRPEIDDRITSAKTSFRSVYGDIATHWEIREGTLSLTVEIPPNTCAEIFLPRADKDAVTECHTPLSSCKDIRGVEQVGDKTLVEVGSGTYSFEYGIS